MSKTIRVALILNMQEDSQHLSLLLGTLSVFWWSDPPWDLIKLPCLAGGDLGHAKVARFPRHFWSNEIIWVLNAAVQIATVLFASSAGHRVHVHTKRCESHRSSSCAYWSWWKSQRSHSLVAEYGWILPPSLMLKNNNSRYRKSTKQCNSICSWNRVVQFMVHLIHMALQKKLIAKNWLPQGSFFQGPAGHLLETSGDFKVALLGVTLDSVIWS